MAQDGPELPMISRACPLCGRSDASRLFAWERFDPSRLRASSFASRKPPECMHFRLHRCAACDVVYADPAPDAGALARAYGSASFDAGLESQYAARTYARLLRRVLDQFPERAGALDIGAGDGAFLGELLALGFTDVVGIEPSEAPVAGASPAVRPMIRNECFSPASFEECRFRLVTCFQTLEHLPDPLAVCQGAFRLLKPGGVALVVVHNRRALSARLLGRKSPIYDVEHLQLFSPRSAALLLARAGFARVEVRRVVNRYPVRHWLRLLPLPQRLKAWAQRTRVGLLPLPLPAGNLAVFGRKDVGRADVADCPPDGPASRRRPSEG